MGVLAQGPNAQVCVRLCWSCLYRVLMLFVRWLAEKNTFNTLVPVADPGGPMTPLAPVLHLSRMRICTKQDLWPPMAPDIGPWLNILHLIPHLNPGSTTGSYSNTESPIRLSFIVMMEHDLYCLYAYDEGSVDCFSNKMKYTNKIVSMAMMKIE